MIEITAIEIVGFYNNEKVIEEKSYVTTSYSIAITRFISSIKQWVDEQNFNQCQNGSSR